MKVVTQNVESAKVFFEGQEIASISKGMVLYIGISRDEKQNSAKWLISHIKENIEENSEVLCLSQFTLFGQLCGNKPSFHRAERPEIAEVYFYDLVSKIRNTFSFPVRNGIFGKNLQIELEGTNITVNYIEHQ